MLQHLAAHARTHQRIVGEPVGRHLPRWRLLLSCALNRAIARAIAEGFHTSPSAPSQPIPLATEFTPQHLACHRSSGTPSASAMPSSSSASTAAAPQQALGVLPAVTRQAQLRVAELLTPRLCLLLPLLLLLCPLSALLPSLLLLPPLLLPLFPFSDAVVVNLLFAALA